MGPPPSTSTPLLDHLDDQGDPGWGPASHLSELMKIREGGSIGRSFLQHAKASTPVALLRFTLHGIQNFVVTVILSPTTVFLDPLSSFASGVIYPIIWAGLLVVATIFWIASHLGGNHLVKFLGKTYADGFSVPNWLDPTIFDDESKQIIDSARAVLSGAATTVQHPLHAAYAKGERPPATVRVFSLPVARTFLLFSAIVYERDDKKVQKAADLSSTDRAGAEKLLVQSERRIRAQAKLWNLHYEGVSSLTSPAGPFASIFYPRRSANEKPWIALVFKGTSADNFAEILVDANISRTPGAVFFGAGTVHEGFYSDLFPQNTGGADGYSTIRTHIAALAKEMRTNYTDPATGRSEPIALWVTGHSLGSALATLIYARFLQSPEDLGPDVVLRDCYSYGTPRLGDGSWAGAFEGNLIKPVDRPNILWRVVNHFDAVCQVPPGLADNDRNRATLGLSVLNFAHIGTQVQLSPLIKPFYAIQNGYFRTTTVSLLQDSRPPADRGTWKSSRILSLERAGWNPVRLLVALLPAPMYDHFPAAYFHHMNLIDATVQTQTHIDQHIVKAVTAGATEISTPPAVLAAAQKTKGNWASPASA